MPPSSLRTLGRVPPNSIKAPRTRLTLRAQAAPAAAPAAPAAPVAAAQPSTSRCPFAKAASFFAAANPHAATARPGASPVGVVGGPDAATPHLWLEAGVSGQNFPGRLVSGLRKLDLGEFLLQKPEEMEHELGLKRRCARGARVCAYLLV